MWCYLFALAFSIRTGCFSDWSFEFFCLNFYKTQSFIFFRIKWPAFALSCGSGCISRMDNFSGLVNSGHKAYFTFLPLLVCLCFHKTPSPLKAGACFISPGRLHAYHYWTRSLNYVLDGYYKNCRIISAYRIEGEDSVLVPVPFLTSE